ADAAIARIRPVAEEVVTTGRPVRVRRRAAVRRLVARLGAVAVAVGPGARVAAVHGAGAAVARIRPVAEDVVGARRTVVWAAHGRLSRTLEARLDPASDRATPANKSHSVRALV